MSDNNKVIVIVDRRKFVDFKSSIPEEQVIFYESVMKAHGWRTSKVGEHKNKTISIDLDQMIQEGK